MKPFKLGVALLTIVISMGSSSAQDNSRAPEGSNVARVQGVRSTPAVEQASDFDALRRKRVNELNAIAELQQGKQAYEQSLASAYDQQEQTEARIRDLKSPQSIEEIDTNINRVNSEKAKFQGDLADAKAAPSPDAKTIDEITKNIAYMNRYGNELEYQRKSADKAIKDYNDEKKRLEDQLTKFTNAISTIKNNLANAEGDINNHRQTLQQTDDDISKLLIAQDHAHSFKMIMSGVFAFLVAIVIAGFFYVAVNDNKVREAIFSHESGIQFITLFSLVIAIILFGIIGILEGKELAALLGGLSGYILGRGTSASRQPSAGDEIPQRRQPPAVPELSPRPAEAAE